MESLSALKDFDYELPREFIASYPASKRSDARLLVLNRKTEEREHRIFRDLPDYLKAGDLLVLNNTKVLPARLFGAKPSGGKVAALLLKPVGESDWEVLIKPNGRVKKGTRIIFGENGVRLEGEMLDDTNGATGLRKIRFKIGDGPNGDSPWGASPEGVSPTGPSLISLINQIGRVPLPPYLGRLDEVIDRELYQTIFAEKEGAVASPTAGLHFDEELLESLRRKEIEICFVTLHVSYGTFQSVQEEDLSKHHMYEEEFEISGEAAKKIQCALKEKRRIVACGTTVVRTLETVGEKLETLRGTTRLFIYPPYEFKMVDAMITNFHLPRTTLLMLVSAFAGRDFIFRSYEEAIRQRYRFYSYGDAMLIL